MYFSFLFGILLGLAAPFSHDIPIAPVPLIVVSFLVWFLMPQQCHRDVIAWDLNPIIMAELFTISCWKMIELYGYEIGSQDYKIREAQSILEFSSSFHKDNMRGFMQLAACSLYCTISTQHIPGEKLVKTVVSNSFPITGPSKPFIYLIILIS